MVSIIGKGNVGTHLASALKDKTDVELINSRTLKDLSPGTDIIIIAVSDSAISKVLEKIPSTDAIIAHTAGSVSIDVLKEYSNRVGVFYPLQTFTKGDKIEYEKIPVFIEGSAEEVEEKLVNLARLFSNDVRKADSVQREKLHLASVFACNFTNALAGIADYILQENGMDYHSVIPLMEQTIKKLDKMTPGQAQTGPAVRRDFNIIEKHINSLKDYPNLKNIYELFTLLIQNGKL